MPIISASSGGRRTRLLLFEPSRCDESNIGGSVLLSPLDAEIIGKTSINQLFIDILPIISVTNDDRKRKLPSFDSSYRDGSDGSSFVLLPPLDAKIIGKTSKNRPFYRHFAEIIGETSIKFAKNNYR